MIMKSRHDYVLIEKYTVAPAPSRDYYGIKVTLWQVCFYHWKVSRFQSIVPTVHYESFEGFRNNTSFHNQIEFIFGGDTLLDMLTVTGGTYDCLSHLPISAMNRIFNLLDLKDIATIACTCKHLAKLASRNEVWENMFRKYFPKYILNRVDKGEIRRIGWRKFFKNRWCSFVHQNPKKGLTSRKGTMSKEISSAYNNSNRKQTSQITTTAFFANSTSKAHVSKSAVICSTNKFTEELDRTVNTSRPQSMKSRLDLKNSQTLNARPKQSNSRVHSSKSAYPTSKVSIIQNAKVTAASTNTTHRVSSDKLAVYPITNISTAQKVSKTSRLSHTPTSGRSNYSDRPAKSITSLGK